MKLLIDISKDRYDEIMAMDWKNGGWLFSKELKAIHDGKAIEEDKCKNCEYSINPDYTRCKECEKHNKTLI